MGLCVLRNLLPTLIWVCTCVFSPSEIQVCAWMLVYSEFPLDYGLICDWYSYGYVFDGGPEKKTLVMDTVILKRKFGFALLHVVAEGTGRTCSEGGKKKFTYLFLEGEKVCILNIMVKQILRLIMQVYVC